MIKQYAFSIQGKSHIEQSKPCQDSHKIIVLGNGYTVAVAADGVGACSKADIGSNLAVDTVCDFIFDNFPIDNNPLAVKSMIRCAYNKALIEIDKRSKADNIPIEEYDTTLMLVIVNENGEGCYASVGDGGIIGLTEFGTYKFINSTQNFEGTVIPLRLGADYWQIDDLPEAMASICICTDGVLSAFNRKYIDGEFYVPLLMLFADPNCINMYSEFNISPDDIFDNTDKSNEDLKKTFDCLYKVCTDIYDFNKEDTVNNLSNIIKNGVFVKLINDVNDDKTLLCIYRDNVIPEPKSWDYYKEPEWDKILSSINKKLYPHLFYENSEHNKSDDKLDNSFNIDDETVCTNEVSKDSNVIDKKVRQFLSFLFGS